MADQLPSHSVAFLLSHDPTLCEAIASCSQETGRIRVVRCDSLDAVRAQEGNQEIAFLLTHLAQRARPAESELLRFIARASKKIHTVVFSDRYQDQQAVRFLRAGAVDYVGLPIDSIHLNCMMDVLTARARWGGSSPNGGPSFVRGIDHCPYVLDPGMAELRNQIRRIAAQDTTILFTGETGTGKTQLAHLIHEVSPRRNQPFLVVDCGTLSRHLIESEMFGHVRGAFTGAAHEREGKFAAAGSGTVLLDEINSLPYDLQGKLLRAVDDRVFESVGSNKVTPLRARLIVASNRPLEREVAEGRFRADLYYRLNVLGFALHPLRDRSAAIPRLVNRFLAEFARRHERDLVQMHPKAMQALTRFPWPGNIRELRNVVERLVCLCPENEIQITDLPDVIQRWRPRTPSERIVRWHPSVQSTIRPEPSVE